MAELVELQMERSMIEFEQMKALKMFDEDHIKLIIKEREAFEYKLVKQEKTLRDYLEYIAYELKLLKLIQERQHERSSQLKLELSIIKKIKKLYGIAISRFPEAERLWDECFFFHVRNNSDQAEIRSILTRKRQFHGDKADCWLMAIKWERKVSTDLNSYEDVRELLVQAIHRHPTCIPLCVELINIILTSPIDVELRMQQVMASYLACTKYVNTLEFHLAILEEANKHTFAAKLETQILEDMKKMYFMEPLFWHTIAQRELQGLPTYHAAIDKKPPTMRSRIELCVQVYQAAVADLDTPEMWAYYLDTVLFMNIDKSSQLPLRRRMLGQAYKKADIKGRMNLEHYSNYVDIMYECNADDELVEEIIERAIAKFGDSIDMWTIYMKHFIRTNNADRVKNVFELSRKRLAQAAAPLWKLYISYLNTLTPTAAKAVYEEVLKQHTPEFDGIKMNFIDWAYTMGGLKYTLHVYKQADTLGTMTIGMVEKINEMYTLHLEPNKNDWRELLERAIVKFGNTHPVMWFMLIDFESKQGEPMNVSKITQRAKHTLNPDLLDKFLADLNMQMISM